jgi:hypothetical protein
MTMTVVRVQERELSLKQGLRLLIYQRQVQG